MARVVCAFAVDQHACAGSVAVNLMPMVWPRPSPIDRVAETAREVVSVRMEPCRTVAGDVQEVGAFPERVTLGAAMMCGYASITIVVAQSTRHGRSMRSSQSLIVTRRHCPAAPGRTASRGGRQERAEAARVHHLVVLADGHHAERDPAQPGVRAAERVVEGHVVASGHAGRVLVCDGRVEPRWRGRRPWRTARTSQAACRRGGCA